MEELEKELKELNGFATPKEEQQYQPTKPPPPSTPSLPPELPGSKHQPKVHIEGLIAPSAYVAEDGLIWHQWEEKPLIL